MRCALSLMVLLGAASAEAGAGRYAVGGAAGWMSWGTAYGGQENGLMFRLQARRQLDDLLPFGDWLGVGVALDGGWLHEGTRQLDYWNTQTCLAVPLGLLHSFERLRVQLELEPGLALETSRVRDGVGPARDGLRLSPTLAFVGGVGLPYRAVAVGFLHGGVRLRPGRLDILVLLGVDWRL